MEVRQRQNAVYVLGHSEDELQRLINQSRFFGDLTEQVLINAGIESGMRVLDVGCGAGDVSFLLAKMVGPSGAVIGIDKSAEAIAAARDRAQTAGLENVTFSEGDITDISLEHPVDAAVGRFILMYLSDPAAALRRIAGYVKAGGVIAFQEMDMRGVKSLPRLPLFERYIDWVVETFRRGGTEIQMGLKLYPTFISAGLPAPQMVMSARVEGGPQSPAYEQLTQLARTLLPMMEKLGVARAEDVGIETLAQRLRDEVVSGGGVIVLPNLIGAWARKPT
ncbi:MAG TPA: class I SAM-dependent methyltransferase [Blastocatellia bacterium]|nr:class I SAM-dependent methyltransferase [Blastocatellia bacterium]